MKPKMGPPGHNRQGKCLEPMPRQREGQDLARKMQGTPGPDEPWGQHMGTGSAEASPASDAGASEDELPLPQWSQHAVAHRRRHRTQEHRQAAGSGAHATKPPPGRAQPKPPRPTREEA